MKSAGLFVLVLFTGVTALGSEDGTPPAQTALRAIAPRDFFVYGCAREFAKKHSLPLYDSSVAYVVEYGGITYAEMDRIYAAAKAFALTLPTPNLRDPEHGGVPVMLQCLDESRIARVDALIQRKSKAKD